MIPRRSFLTSSLIALCAPAIIRTPGLLMPIRPLPLLLTHERWACDRSINLSRSLRSRQHLAALGRQHLIR